MLRSRPISIVFASLQTSVQYKVENQFEELQFDNIEYNVASNIEYKPAKSFYLEYFEDKI